MGRTTWFQQNGYASPAPYFCEDQELLLRTHKCSNFHVLAEALLGYRVHSGVQWGKRCRTRIALLRLQAAYFFKEKEFHSVLLALLVAAVRILRDALWVVIPMGHIGVKKLKSTPGEDKFIEYWASVLPGWDSKTKRWLRGKY